MTRRRYLGVAKESTYGTKVAPKFFVDPTSLGLNTPDAPEMIKPGSLTRVPQNHAPGMYTPSGPVEFTCDAPLLWYFLWLLLGDKTTTDNTSSQTAEELLTTGAGETTGSGTLGSLPVVPGTLTIELDGGADVAEDDGFGNITELAASGVTGSVNYATGVVTLAGLTESSTYDADYDNGTFSHVITVDESLQEMLSATLKLGKDEFMHTFVGCAFSQLTLDVEKEWATISIDVLAQKDEKEAILTLPNVTIPQGYPVPFHKVTAKAVDYGGTLADISAVVEKLTLTINNNADAEGGTTIGSRFPRKIYPGEVEIMVDMTLAFDNTNDLENFWGGASGPSASGVVEQALQITLDSAGVLGSVIFDLYKAIPLNVGLTPSGRERLTQELSFQVLYDAIADEVLTATCTSPYNYA